MYEPVPIKLTMKFTLNGKQIEVTDSWESMTFSQYLRLLKAGNDLIEMISILTGVEYEILKKAEIKGIEKLLYAAQFTQTAPKFPEKPTHIGKYKLPLNDKGIFDIQFESLAQFEDMRQIMNKLEVGVHAHTEAYASYCAIYLQKIRDGEYNGQEALKMIPEIMAMPAGDVISAGGFFFIKLTSLLNGTQNNSPITSQPRRKVTGTRSRKRSAHKRR